MRDALGNIIEEGDVIRLPALPAEKQMEDCTVVEIRSAILNNPRSQQGPTIKLILTQQREIEIPAQISKLEQVFIVKKKDEAAKHKSSLIETA